MRDDYAWRTRLTEMQEETLWVCDAAHMPVVWATQVLESRAKLGLPLRVEITDAAMGRAASVRLNDGLGILEAVQVVSGILHRMQDHQIRQRAVFQRLELADDLLAPTSVAR